MIKIKNVLFCLPAIILSCLIFVSACSADANKITENGISYKKVNLTNDNITVQAYYVSGCEDSIEILNIPDKINGLSVLGIDKYAFLNHTNLREVTLPDSITQGYLCWAPFKGCTNIEKLTLAFCDVMLLFTDYGSGEMNKEITVPSSLKYLYLTEGCKSIKSRTLYYCTNIKEIHIPKSVTEINDGTGLINVGVNGNPSNSERFSWLPFIGCTNLKIYCEANAKPDGWGTYWNYIDSSTSAPVYWDHY